MFTADGLRPDSPHLVPPRGAAFVLSLCSRLCLAPSSRCLPPTVSKPVAISLSCPATRSRFPTRPAFSRRSSSSVSRPLERSSRLVPRPGCPAASAKAGNPEPRERERISDREKTDCGRRPSDIRDARSRLRQTIPLTRVPPHTDETGIYMQGRC